MSNLVPAGAGAQGNGAGRALVLVAHGSRRVESNREVEALTARVRAASGGRYALVTHGFLELAEPGVDQVLEEVVAQGAREVVVVPYFLAAGRHVTEDLPAAVLACQARHPEVSFCTTAHLGATEVLAETLLRVATPPAERPDG
jgi:sirohydrochlorin ferrochelatase